MVNQMGCYGKENFCDVCETDAVDIVANQERSQSCCARAGAQFRRPGIRILLNDTLGCRWQSS